MAILTNYFLWMTVGGLIGALLSWRWYRRVKEELEFTENERKGRIKFVLSLVLFIILLLIGLAGLAGFVVQVLRTPDLFARDAEPAAEATVTEEAVSTPTLTPEAPETEDEPEETAVPTATPSPTPDTANLAYIGNTNFQGVNMRAGPTTSSEIIAKLVNATEVVRLGRQQEADGYVWQEIMLADGTIGWVASDFLVTRTPTPVP